MKVFSWYLVRFTIHYIFLFARASVLLKSISLQLIIMLYPWSSPLSLSLCFFFSTNNLNTSSPCPPFACMSFPCLSLTPFISHRFLSLAFMFATSPQSIPLTLVFFNSLFDLLLSLFLRLYYFFLLTFPQKIKGSKIFNVRCVNKVHEQARSAEI